MARIEQSLTNQPAIDQKRVDAISHALANGTYTVQPDKIAGGLIQSARALAQLPLAEI
jgi:negative regulator of flagellin synthesis FlgM